MRLKQRSAKLLTVVTASLLFPVLAQVHASAQTPTSDAAQSTQTTSNNFLSHRAIFRSLSKAGVFRSNLRAAPVTTEASSWADGMMSAYQYLWSSADALDVGGNVLFPGADAQTGIQYVWVAMPNTQSVFGVGTNPDHTSVLIVEPSTGTTIEFPWREQTPARIFRKTLDPRTANQKSDGAHAQFDFSGLTSQFQATASCLWNNIVSTLHIQNWSDLAGLACSASSASDGMVSFGKEIAGCATGGVTGCVFLAADIGVFISSPACRPDWVNTCMNATPEQGSGGGAPTPAIILAINPLSTPIPGQQFIAQVHVANVPIPSLASVVVTGPGCPTMTSCVVPSGAITPLLDYLNVPLTLAEGSFTVYVQQLGQVSNGWPLSVGPASGTPNGGGSTPNLVVSFKPSAVPNSGGGSWNYSVAISETGGGTVILTGLNIGGNDYSSYISQWFGTNQIPAKGLLSGSFTTKGSPGNLTWTVSGGGRSWSGVVTLQP